MQQGATRKSSTGNKDGRDEVPEHLRQEGFFVEIFAGTARLTMSMSTLGVMCLPPVELNPQDWFDKSDAFEAWPKLEAWVESGAINYAHFGTECKTFSRARRHDGKAPPIRHPETLKPLPSCNKEQREKVLLGTRMAEMTFQLCTQLELKNAAWTVENPASSMIWNMEEVALL